MPQSLTQLCDRKHWKQLL